MKVKELQEHLAAQDPEMEVVVALFTNVGDANNVNMDDLNDRPIMEVAEGPRRGDDCEIETLAIFVERD